MSGVWGERLVPARGAYALLNVRVPACVTDTNAPIDFEGCKRIDVLTGIDGAIVETTAHGQLKPAQTIVQGHGRQLWPCFVDIHTHLDKTGTWDRAPNLDGSFDGAIEASSRARQQPWSEKDVFVRMDASVAEAWRTGTMAIRTHIDSKRERSQASWRAFAALQSKWRGKMVLQGVVLALAREMSGGEGVRMADLAVRMGAVFGAVIRPSPILESELGVVFALAERRRLDLDFHVDETGGAQSQGLLRIAEMALSRNFKGKIVCGHACSLSLHSEEEARRTIVLLERARIGVVALPATNLYLQDRKLGVTPVWRGVTRVHELRAGAVPVAIAGDNRSDPFYPFGNYDMLEVFRDAIRIAHLDTPMASWVDAVSSTPASMMGLASSARIVAGAPADFILFRQTSAAETIGKQGRARIVVRRGRAIGPG
jgi:cytosine deaminase